MSAFASKLDKEFHTLQVQYKSPADMEEICVGEKPESNLNVQMLILNKKLKFEKFIQAKEMTIPYTDKFEDLPAKVEFEVL